MSLLPTPKQVDSILGGVFESFYTAVKVGPALPHGVLRDVTKIALETFYWEITTFKGIGLVKKDCSPLAESEFSLDKHSHLEEREELIAVCPFPQHFALH